MIILSTTRRSMTVARKATAMIAGGTCVISFAVATYYRPLPATSHESLHTEDASPTKRDLAIFCSKQSPYFSRSEAPFFLSLAQKLSIGVTTLAIRLFMNTYGHYHIVNDENYQHFLSLVLGGDGRAENNQSLITISNHRSLFDDPGVVSCLLPIWVGVQPKFNRYGICSQEYCFSDKLPIFIKGYIGAGKK